MHDLWLGRIRRMRLLTDPRSIEIGRAAAEGTAKTLGIQATFGAAAAFVFVVPLQLGEEHEGVAGKGKNEF